MRSLPLVLAALGAVPVVVIGLEWAGWVELSAVRFEHPFVALLTAPLLCLIAWRLTQLPARLSSLRRGLIEALSGSAALAAALAALGLEIGRPLDRLVVIVAVDKSRSIDLVPGASGRIASELLAAEISMRDDDRIGRLVFGATSAIEDPPRGKSTLPNPQKAEVARDGTDIGAAIRQALAAVPPDSAARIALVSDGVATRGDALAAALSATALGIPIDVVPLDQGTIPNVRVASLRLTPRAARGEALDLKLVTEAGADAEVEVRVYRDGELIRRGPTKIAAGPGRGRAARNRAGARASPLRRRDQRARSEPGSRARRQLRESPSCACAGHRPRSSSPTRPRWPTRSRQRFRAQPSRWNAPAPLPPRRTWPPSPATI